VRMGLTIGSWGLVDEGVGKGHRRDIGLWDQRWTQIEHRQRLSKAQSIDSTALLLLGEILTVRIEASEKCRDAIAFKFGAARTGKGREGGGGGQLLMSA